MADMYERQQRALAKAKQVLIEAEKSRSFETIEPLIEPFSLGRSDILRDSHFVENLGDYLHHLYLNNQRTKVLSLLIVFEKYIESDDRELRENSVSITAKLSTLVSDSNDLELLSSLFLLLARWIEIEAIYISSYGVACSQLHKISQRLFLHEKNITDNEPGRAFRQTLFENRDN